MKTAALLVLIASHLFGQICTHKLTKPIATGSTVQVFRNGLLQCIGSACGVADYSVSGLTIAMKFWTATDVFKVFWQTPNLTGQWPMVQEAFTCLGSNIGAAVLVKPEQLSLPAPIPGPAGKDGAPGPQGPPGPVGLMLLSGASLAAADTGATVDLTLQVQPGLEPAALQFSFTFDPAVITGISATAGTIATAAGKDITCAPGPQPGLLSCILAGLNQSTMGNGVIASVTLVVGSAPSAFIGVANTAGATPAGDSDSFNGIGATLSRSGQ